MRGGRQGATAPDGQRPNGSGGTVSAKAKRHGKGGSGSATGPDSAKLLLVRGAAKFMGPVQSQGARAEDFTLGTGAKANGDKGAKAGNTQATLALLEGSLSFR